jgi:hypothetical protein
MYFKVLSKITPDKLIGKKTQCWQIVRRPCTSMSFVAGKISCLRLPFPQTSICIVREYTHGDISMCIVYISVYCIRVYVFCVDIHTYITKIQIHTDAHIPTQEPGGSRKDNNKTCTTSIPQVLQRTTSALGRMTY